MQDVMLADVDSSKAIGAFTRLEDVVGLSVKLHVPGHAILKPGLLRKSYVIDQGQYVSVVFEGDGFTVEAEGQAQRSGGRGDRMTVKMKKGAMVSGIVQEDGRVHVSTR